MSTNRFLGLEKELQGFSNKETKKPNKLTKGKSGYSLQKVAPAVGAALVGVGWKIFEFMAASSASDIEVKLSRMDGAKYPKDDEVLYKVKGVWNTQSVTVQEKHVDGLVIKDAIYAGIEMRFKYNGYGVADIDMDLKDVNDALGWSLVVGTKLMPDRNSYISRNGGQNMAMVEATFNFRWNTVKPFEDDIIKIVRYKLYGDGTVIKT